jgi:hypothetical protein
MFSIIAEIHPNEEVSDEYHRPVFDFGLLGFRVGVLLALRASQEERWLLFAGLSYVALGAKDPTLNQLKLFE